VAFQQIDEEDSIGHLVDAVVGVLVCNNVLLREMVDVRRVGPLPHV